MHENNIYEIVGYIALILNVWGNMALTNKSIKGWIIRLVCNVAWVIYSYYFNVMPLLINHVLFAGINILGWYRWSKAEPKDELLYKVIMNNNKIETLVTIGMNRYWAKNIRDLLNKEYSTNLIDFKMVRET